MELRDDSETLEKKHIMRSELLELYQAAVDYPTKENVKTYREAINRIGPSIVMSEVLRVEELSTRLDKLERALKDIINYTAYSHPDEDIIAERDAALKESNECTECQYAKQAGWKTSGLCNIHYRTVTRAENKVKQMFDYKQKWEPVEIARKALDGMQRLPMIDALRDALLWWIECSDSFRPSGWGFWLRDDATDELGETENAAWDEVLRTLEETK